MKLALVGIALLLAACGAARTTTPTAAASSSPDVPVPASAAASPAPLYSVQKFAEGAHGSAPLIDLPAAVAIDYRVSGNCLFSISLATETSTAGLPSMSMSMTGPEVTGTWRLSIAPGRYYVATGEAVGCVYLITVLDDG
jgi:hypothetical protein